jgi:hypothetical protein
VIVNAFYFICGSTWVGFKLGKGVNWNNINSYNLKLTQARESGKPGQHSKTLPYNTHTHTHTHTHTCIYTCYTGVCVSLSLSVVQVPFSNSFAGLYFVVVVLCFVFGYRYRAFLSSPGCSQPGSQTGDLPASAS